MSEYTTVTTDSHTVVSLTPISTEQIASYQISVGSFYDRFGAEKWNILASTNPVVKALIADVSVRRFVDLQRPDLTVALDLVIANGFAIDKGAILNTPCQPGEEP